MSELITNIHNIVPTPYELEALGGLDADLPRMLSRVSTEAATHDGQRAPFNTHIAKIDKNGGKRAAKILLGASSTTPIFPDTAMEFIPDEDIWLGASRIGSTELSGSVIDQRNVSIENGLGQLVICNGILIEAVTTPDKRYLLPDHYEAGLMVAEAMQTDNEVIFAIEAAEDPGLRKSKLRNWADNKLKMTKDPELHASVFKHFAHRIGPLELRRTDFEGKETRFANIYTNSKIDLTGLQPVG